jgi:hypothetical protein
MRTLSLLIIFISIFVNFALAESTVSCHCFQDREYDPQRATAADPYFLATTQNALLANLFGLHKKDVVKAKMGGADGDRLWIGHYLAQKGNQPHAEIEALYSQKGGWSEVIKELKIDPEQLGPRFVAALSNQKKLAMVVVDLQLMAHLDVAPAQLQKLREQGADNQQTVLAVFIGQLSALGSVELFAMVVGGKASWGSLLSEQGMFNGSAIENKWRQLLKKEL